MAAAAAWRFESPALALHNCATQTILPWVERVIMEQKDKLKSWRGWVSIAAGLIGGLYYWQPLIPNISHFIPNFPEFIDQRQFRPVRHETNATLAEQLQFTLQQMSDAELSRISEAERPCVSKLLNCNGFSDSYTRKLAAAERLDRAKRLEVELKKAHRAVEEQEAEYQKMSAQAAVRVAADSEIRTFYEGLGAAAAVATVLFGIITFVIRQIQKKAKKVPTEAVQQPLSPAAPPAAESAVIPEEKDG
jgi:hypothetical protein